MTATFLIYILKWALVLTLLYSLYGFALRRETFHGFNRAVLLSILGLSMLLPLCRVHTDYIAPVAEQVEEVETFIHDMSDYYAVEEAETPPATVVDVAGDGADDTTVVSTVVSSWNRINVWLRFIIIVYVAGLAIVWLAYLRSLISLFILIARGRRVHIDGLPKWVRVVESRVAVTPCSWMCWIILSPDEISDTAVRHEMTHLRFRHSFDLLLAEFTARMLWFLPVGWMLLQDLKDVHEYQVDHRLLSNGVDAEEYQELLINQVTAPNNMANRSYAVANSLVLSSIKKRFVMMYKKPSSRKAALKALYLLPCTLLALTVMAKPTVMNNIQETLKQEEAVAPLLSPEPIVEQMVNNDALEAGQEVAEETAKREELSADDVKNRKTTADSVSVDSVRKRDIDVSKVLNELVRDRAKAETEMFKKFIAQGFVPVGDQKEELVFEHNDGRVIRISKDLKRVSYRYKSDKGADEASTAKKIDAEFYDPEDSSVGEETDNPVAEARVEMYLEALRRYQRDGYVISRETETQVFLSNSGGSMMAVAKPSLEEQKQFAQAKKREQALKAKGKGVKEQDNEVKNKRSTVGDYKKNYKLKDLPANRAPKIVREKGDNYDYFDHETFPTYEDFQYVDIPHGARVDATTNAVIYPSKKVTYVVFYENATNHDNDEWVFFLYPSNCCIIDADTGERYQIRKLHHYPLDTFILHHNNAQSIHVFVAEFPPLDNSVQRVRFEYPKTPARKWWRSNGSISNPIWISDLVPPIR